MPSFSGFKSFSNDHTPPTTIAPTPRYLILVVQISKAAVNGSPSKPTTAEYIGIANPQEINPPAKTKMPIFLPTIYPTEIRAGERSLPIPKIEPPIARAPAASACHIPKPC